MVHRLEQVGTVGRDSPAAVDARRTLREMCDSLGELLREAQRPAQRVSMSVGSVSLEIEWPAAAAPVAADPPPVPPAATPEQPEGHHVGAPLVGTFYSAPAPGAPPFVAVGDVIEVGQQIGIVEAMKLMNAVEADRSGRVAEILVADSQPVEYEQPLVRIVPSGQD